MYTVCNIYAVYSTMFTVYIVVYTYNWYGITVQVYTEYHTNYINTYIIYAIRYTRYCIYIVVCTQIVYYV